MLANLVLCASMVNKSTAFLERIVTARVRIITVIVFLNINESP